jgi:serine/threonine protein kinase
MPLALGDRLGPYEILALIGAGGMGEVYRARDPRVNREVAIKISTAQFTSVSSGKLEPSPLSTIPTFARSTTSARTTW